MLAQCEAITDYHFDDIDAPNTEHLTRAEFTDVCAHDAQFRATACLLSNGTDPFIKACEGVDDNHTLFRGAINGFHLPLTWSSDSYRAEVVDSLEWTEVPYADIVGDRPHTSCSVRGCSIRDSVVLVYGNLTISYDPETYTSVDERFCAWQRAGAWTYRPNTLHAVLLSTKVVVALESDGRVVSIDLEREEEEDRVLFSEADATPSFFGVSGNGRYLTLVFDGEYTRGVDPVKYIIRSSTDGGANWSSPQTIEVGVYTYLHGIVISHNGLVQVLTVGGGYRLSTDGGSTWVGGNASIALAGAGAAAVLVKGGSELILGAGPSGGTQGGGLVRINGLGSQTPTTETLGPVTGFPSASRDGEVIAVAGYWSNRLRTSGATEFTGLHIAKGMYDQGVCATDPSGSAVLFTDRNSIHIGVARYQALVKESLETANALLFTSNGGLRAIGNGGVVVWSNGYDSKTDAIPEVVEIGLPLDSPQHWIAGQYLLSFSGVRLSIHLNILNTPAFGTWCVDGTSEKNCMAVYKKYCVDTNWTDPRCECVDTVYAAEQNFNMDRIPVMSKQNYYRAAPCLSPACQATVKLADGSYPALVGERLCDKPLTICTSVQVNEGVVNGNNTTNLECGGENLNITCDVSGEGCPVGTHCLSGTCKPVCIDNLDCNDGYTCSTEKVCQRMGGGGGKSIAIGVVAAVLVIGAAAFGMRRMRRDRRKRSLKP